jgi:multiple sugar transport system permease protein
MMHQTMQKARGVLVRPARLAGFSRQQRTEILWAYLFLAPSLLGLLIFTIGPIIAAFGLTLFSWDFLTPPRFSGMANFERLLGDQRMFTSYRVTTLYVVGQVALSSTCGLLLALGVNRDLSTPLRYFLRSAYFFPVITSIASVAVIWGYLYNTDRGVINYFISSIGGPRIPWLASSQWALWSVIFMIVWKTLGFDFILFLAGLQNIPRHLYEAALIDGATSAQQFRYITLPLLTPTIFFVIVIGLIGSFQVFDAPYIMTNGGPGDATRTIAMHIYENGFRFLRMGYASAIAMVLFAVILLITIIQMALGKRWVFYQ